MRRGRIDGVLNDLPVPLNYKGGEALQVNVFLTSLYAHVPRALLICRGHHPPLRLAAAAT